MQEFAYLLTILGLVISFVLVSFSKPRTQTSMSFLVVIASLLMWVVASYLSDRITNSNEQTLFYARLALFGPFIAIPALIFFIRAYPYNENRKSRTVNILPLIPLFVFMFIWNTPYNIISVSLGESGWSFEPGVLYGFFGVFAMLSIIYMLRLMINKFRNTSDPERTQLKYLFVSLVTSMVFGIFVALILPIFGVSKYSPLAPISILFFVFTLVFVISRKQFLEISSVIESTIKNLVFFIYLTCVVLLIVAVSSAVHSKYLDVPANLVLIGLVFILGYPFKVILFKLERFVISEDRKEVGELTHSITTFSSTNLELDTLIEGLNKIIVEVYHLKGVTLILSNNGNTMRNITTGGIIIDDRKGLERFLLYNKTRFDKQFSYSDERIKFLQSGKSLDSKEGLFFSKIKDYQINSIFNIKIREHSLVLCIHQRESDKYLSSTEVKGLENILPIISTSIERALLYTEVKGFSQTLQTKVEEATKELEERYEELRQIRAKERDMMDIIGHELRTPISIIRISLGALDLKATKKPEMFTIDEYKKTSEKIHEAVERETKLLETMLLSTKIDVGKLELTYQELDLNKVVEDAILGHQEEVENKKIKIKFHNGDKEHKVYADKVRFSEVVDNLVSNGIKYTEKGGVDIYIDDAGEKMYKVIIADTGIGIPEKAIARLGEKFFRVNQYVNGDFSSEANNVVRPGGTGLGLYVTFGLIKAMGGEVDIQSEVGKGSIFSFTVPKYVGQLTIEGQPKKKNVFERMALNKSGVEDQKVKVNGAGELTVKDATITAKVLDKTGHKGKSKGSSKQKNTSTPKKDTSKK